MDRESNGFGDADGDGILQGGEIDMNDPFDAIDGEDDTEDEDEPVFGLAADDAPTPGDGTPA